MGKKKKKNVLSMKKIVALKIVKFIIIIDIMNYFYTINFSESIQNHKQKINK